MFYNYYAQPGPYNGAAAEMYVCPRPVPAHVGHTWVTYQPLMPHEFMYKHKRSYYTLQPGRRLATHERPLRHRAACAARIG